MEEKEKKHITTNKFDLIKTLSYNSALTSYLEQMGHISRPDVDSLNATKVKDGDFAANSQLLDILKERPGSYVSLIEAARELTQTGVVEILEKLDGFTRSVQSSSTPTFRKYDRKPVGLEVFLTKKPGKSSVFIITTLDIPITCQKLQENVESCSILEYEDFLKIISELTPIKQQLYFVNIPSLHHVKHVITHEVDVNKTNKKIRLVVVTGNGNENDLNNYISGQKPLNDFVQICRDSISWDDLTIFHKHVIKQKLEEMFSIQFENDDLVTTLRGQALVDLINENGLTVFKDTLPDKLSYHIGRRLLSRTCISTKIFEEKSPDVFLFSGMEQQELSQLAKNEMTGTSSSQIHQMKLTVRYILLESPDHYDAICNKSNGVPTHWLLYGNGKLRWKKSNGSITTLQNCVSNEQDLLHEDSFCENFEPNSSLPICISDSPGMGKSVLLAQMGRNLKNIYPERKVVYIVLSEFINAAKQIEMDRNKKKVSIIKILQKTLCKNLVGEVVLKSMLTSKDKIIIELLFDGLDEVDSSDCQFAYELMQELSSFKATRLWITTRSHLLQELESNLNTLGSPLTFFSLEWYQICTNPLALF